MSIDYDYETFMTDFNKQPIDPLNAQIVYDVSFKCSMEEVQLMRMKSSRTKSKRCNLKYY